MLDEFDGVFGVPGRELVLVFVGDVGNDDFVAVEHAEVGITVALSISGREIHEIGVERPHVVGVGQAEVFVEAVVQREELRRIAEVPFAEDGGGVAALFDQFGEGHFVGADADFGARPKRAVDADAVRVAAGQQAATRGGADRLRHVEIAEDAALRGQAIEVRRDEAFRAENADIGVALVVGEDDDDVGELGAGGGAGGGVGESEC